MTTNIDFEPEIQALQLRIAKLQRLRDAKQAEIDEKASQARAFLNDPAAWIETHINWGDDEGLTPYQIEVAAALPVHKRVAVRGPHGLGKTGLAAIVILWFAITREQAQLDWKVLTTASAWRHLTVYLWPEIHKWARRLRWDLIGRSPFNDRTELLDLHLKQHFGAASAVASNEAERIEGAHADSLLYLIDEAKIVPDATWDAIEGAFSGGRKEGYPEALALAISTPGPPMGRFYEIHQRTPGLEDWWVRHVKVGEAIAAGRISQDWVDQRRKQWGENSQLFANRVEGNFYQDTEHAMIPLSWIEAAIERWREWDDAGRPHLEGRRVTGVDVARAGSDQTIIGERQGIAVTDLRPFDQQDTMETTARVTPYLMRGPDGGELEEVDEHSGLWTAVVDSVGVGGGVVDRLRELKLRVLPYTGSSGVDKSVRDRSGEYGFTNVRSAAYWNLRELLDPAYDAELMLPPDDLMIADLSLPTWNLTTGTPPKIQMEKKEELVKRMGRSPDRGDTVAMMYWFERLRRDAQIGKRPEGRLPVHDMSPLDDRYQERMMPRTIPGVGAIRRPRVSAMGPLG